MTKKYFKNLLPDIDMIEFEGMGGNKIEMTKMELQKTNQENYLGVEQLQQDILDNASLWDLQNRLVKALKTHFKCQKVMKDQILQYHKDDLKVKIVQSKKKDYLTRDKLFTGYFW